MINKLTLTWEGASSEIPPDLADLIVRRFEEEGRKCTRVEISGASSKTLTLTFDNSAGAASVWRGRPSFAAGGDIDPASPYLVGERCCGLSALQRTR
jgi:hypothetical protein